MPGIDTTINCPASLEICRQVSINAAQLVPYKKKSGFSTCCVLCAVGAVLCAVRCVLSAVCALCCVCSVSRASSVSRAQCTTHAPPPEWLIGNSAPAFWGMIAGVLIVGMIAICLFMCLCSSICSCICGNKRQGARNRALMLRR